jgi:hypothetical protein
MRCNALIPKTRSTSRPPLGLNDQHTADLAVVARPFSFEWAQHRR